MPKDLKAQILAVLEEAEKVVGDYWNKYGEKADADEVKKKIAFLKKELAAGRGKALGDKDELKQIQEALEEFIEKHGGQYICTVIWPDKPAKKGKIPMGSSHVRTMNSQPYIQAVVALVTGEAMFSKK